MLFGNQGGHNDKDCQWLKRFRPLAWMGCCLLLFLPLLLGGWLFHNRSSDAQPPRLLQPRKERSLPVFGGTIAFSPDSNELLAARTDNTVDPAVIFQLPPVGVDRSPEVRFVRGQPAYQRMAWSPNGKWLAYGGGCAKHEPPAPKMLLLLDSTTGELVHTLVGQGSGALLNIVFSPDSQLLASVSENNMVCLWDVMSGKLVHKLASDGDPDNSMDDVAFSPDGKQVASIDSEHVIRLWDTSTGQLWCTIAQHSDSSWRGAHIAYHPTNPYLLAATSHHSIDDDLSIDDPLSFYTINLWDVRSPTKAVALASFDKRTETISSLAFHPEGRYLASGDSAGWVSIWDVCKKELAYSLYKYPGCGIVKLAFSPDGRRLAVAAGNGQVAVTTIWDLHPGLEHATPR